MVVANPWRSCELCTEREFRLELKRLPLRKGGIVHKTLPLTGLYFCGWAP